MEKKLVRFADGSTTIVSRSFSRESLRVVGAHSSDSSPKDDKLLQQVVGSGGKKSSYISGGFTASLGIRAALRVVGKSIGDFKRVLDFGCGSARLLHWFQDALPQTELYGCDINADAIDWCKRNVPFARFVLSESVPPLPYPSDFFDFVCGISVVTHLDESLHLAWLAELNRIVKPDGILLLTVHGAFAAQNHLSPQQFREFNSKGFFYRRATDRATVEGLPDFYQVAYHTHEYIERVWGEQFEIVGAIRHGSMYMQEGILLRKRKAAPSPMRVLFDLPLGVLEEPLLEKQADDELWIRGWVVNPYGCEPKIDVWIDSRLVARIVCGIVRDDVGDTFHATPAAMKCGFEMILPLTGFRRGRHVVWISPAYETFPIAASHFYRREGLKEDVKRNLHKTFVDWSYRLRCALQLRSRFRRLRARLF
jgi:SAM-dependent methyltransferase